MTPASLPPTEFEALRGHLLEHSVKRGDFVLKSGRRSSWFIDSKQTVCRPEAMVLVADGVLSVIPDDATAIGGLTMGADPVAFVTAGVAATRGRLLKAFSVRKEAKDHGGGGRIAGALDPGDRVVVTEDTVTRGTSLLEAAHAVIEAGAEPVLLVAVVDRGGTVAAMAEAEGLPFRALLTAPDLGLRLRGRLSAGTGRRPSYLATPANVRSRVAMSRTVHSALSVMSTTSEADHSAEKISSVTRRAWSRP